MLFLRRLWSSKSSQALLDVGCWMWVLGGNFVLNKHYLERGGVVVSWATGLGGEHGVVSFFRVWRRFGGSSMVGLAV